jgi:hypothetical protein
MWGTAGRLGSAILVGMVSVACGSKASGGGASTLDTGLPPEKRLVDLTPEEISQVCMAAGNSLESQLSTYFTLDALCSQYAVAAGYATSTTDQGLQSSCATTRTNCLMSPPQSVTDRQLQGPPDFDTAQCASNTTIPATCTATVSQYEQCVNATYAEMSRMLAPLSTCSTTRAAVDTARAEADSNTFETRLEALPACAAVQACDTAMTTTAIAAVPSILH